MKIKFSADATVQVGNEEGVVTHRGTAGETLDMPKAVAQLFIDQGSASRQLTAAETKADEAKAVAAAEEASRAAEETAAKAVADEAPVSEVADAQHGETADLK